MEPDSLDTAGVPHAGGAGMAPPDQMLWAQLAPGAKLQPFARAWLALLARMLPGAERAVLVLREEGGWAPVARWPDGDAGSAQLSHVAELALEQRRGVVSRARGRGGQADPAGASHLAFPLLVDGAPQGVVAAECEGATEASLRAAMRQLQWGIGWIELQQRRAQAALDAARLAQAFAALDVAATGLGAERFEAAARAVATDMAVRLGATRVAIGWLRRRAMRVVAVSHGIITGQRADATLNLAAAMEEAADHAASLLYPPPDHELRPGLAAHARLAAQGGGPQVLTVPLTMHGRIVGAVTLEREAPVDQALIDVTEAVAGLIGPVLGQLRAADRWLATIVLHSAGRALRRVVGPRQYGLKLALLATAAVAGFFATYRTEYRIGGQAVVEGEVRRTIASGLDGYIKAEHARAGQTVRAGEVIAALDDAELNLQRLRWVATRQQHQLELDRALAAGQRADVNIDSAQVAAATAEIALLDEQLARTQIRAPFEGLITNGDLSQSVGMPVQRAQVLYEIAPLDSYRVIIKVSDSDIARVLPGRGGALRLTALPDRSFPLHVTRITPIAEQSDGSNTFRVEARLDEVSPQLRPNMEGVARIDAGRHRLIWNWTHHLIDAARLHLWSWWP